MKDKRWKIFKIKKKREIKGIQKLKVMYNFDLDIMLKI